MRLPYYVYARPRDGAPREVAGMLRLEEVDVEADPPLLRSLALALARLGDYHDPVVYRDGDEEDDPEYRAARAAVDRPASRR